MKTGDGSLSSNRGGERLFLSSSEGKAKRESEEMKTGEKESEEKKSRSTASEFHHENLGQQRCSNLHLKLGRETSRGFPGTPEPLRHGIEKSKSAFRQLRGYQTFNIQKRPSRVNAARGGEYVLVPQPSQAT